MHLGWGCRTPGAQVLLRYSADVGKTWIGINLPGNAQSFDVDLDQLPGGEQCCFELLSSAGLRTSAVRSKFFSVAAKRPRPLMIAPIAGGILKSAGPIELVGAPTEPGAADLLTWTSSLDGFLGRGAYLLIPVLSSGRHRIGLHLGNPDDRSQYATVVVTRGRPKV